MGDYVCKTLCQFFGLGFVFYWVCQFFGWWLCLSLGLSVSWELCLSVGLSVGSYVCYWVCVFVGWYVIMPCNSREGASVGIFNYRF